jgi:NAD(P)-dependent dehydrogenase (short-subunit alcohol dehydrogenase family)
MNGKTVLITGGNAGIGKETAVALARMGARVVITARNAARGDAARDEIRERSGHDVDVLPLDLASFASVRAAAEKAAASYDRLDVLVNNAGGVLGQRAMTEDGHERQFQINHLGPFLLTNLLREHLVASAPARVVVVASNAHKSARRGLDFDDLEGSKGRYRGFQTYYRSKLMNVLFARELARRLDGTNVTANSLHPGFVASKFAKEGDLGWWGNIGMPLTRPFAISPEKGARTSVYVASSPELDGVTGEYFEKSKIAKPSAHGQDDAAAARLWTVSAEMTGVPNRH